MDKELLDLLTTFGNLYGSHMRDRPNNYPVYAIHDGSKENLITVGDLRKANEIVIRLSQLPTDKQKYEQVLWRVREVFQQLENLKDNSLFKDQQKGMITAQTMLFSAFYDTDLTKHDGE